MMMLSGVNAETTLQVGDLRLGEPAQVVPQRFPHVDGAAIAGERFHRPTEGRVDDAQVAQGRGLPMAVQERPAV